MAKQLNNENAVKKLLSLGSVDPILVDTLCNLREAGRESWDYIAGLCHNCKNIDTITKVIEGVTASAPYQAEEWFDILLHPIMEFLDFTEYHPEPKFEPEYALGFIKGIFKASNWYDDNYYVETILETSLVEKFVFLNKYFLEKNPLTEMADGLLQNDKFAEKYEGQLSNLIKTFVRHETNRGARMASAVQLVQNTYLKIKKDEIPNEEVSRIGTIIFDQIAYAIFGSLSTYGRAKAIYLLNQNVLSSPSKIT